MRTCPTCHRPFIGRPRADGTKPPQTPAKTPAPGPKTPAPKPLSAADVRGFAGVFPPHPPGELSPEAAIEALAPSSPEGVRLLEAAGKAGLPVGVAMAAALKMEGDRLELVRVSGYAEGRTYRVRAALEGPKAPPKPRDPDFIGPLLPPNWRPPPGWTPPAEYP